MNETYLLEEPGRVDEPGAVQAFSEMLTRVAAERRPLIVCRNGADLAAVIPVDHLELVREVLARREMEELSAQIDWERARKVLRPAQEWFDSDEPKPF